MLALSVFGVVKLSRYNEYFKLNLDSCTRVYCRSSLIYLATFQANLEDTCSLLDGVHL